VKRGGNLEHIELLGLGGKEVAIEPGIRNSNLVPIKIEFPISIVIIFAVGWILILLGYLGNSAFLDYRPVSIQHTYFQPIEPWYSVSTAVIGIGFMFLAIFHILLFVKLKLGSSMATLPLIIVLSMYLLAIAQERLSETTVITATLEWEGFYVFGLIMIFALGMHGYELFLLGRSESLLKLWGIFIMFSGLPLFIIFFLPRPFQTLILVLALLVLLIIISLYRLSLKGVWYFQDRVIPDLTKRTKDR
jgi:hypothetical protein